LLRVELKSLHGEVGAIADFLSSKSKVPVRTRGSALEMQNISAKDVKHLLHKFLHQRGLDDYRVVVVHLGLLEILQPEPQSPHEAHQPKGSPPTAPATMPYYFPGGSSLPSSVKKSKKKREK